MTADPEPKVSPDTTELTSGKPRQPLSDGFLWPGWLPIKARLPLVGVITGFVALTALLFGPWWAQIPQRPPIPQSAVALPPAMPLPAPVRQVPPQRNASVRPAHLNLDVRHSFNSITLSVSVDGKAALKTRVEGSSKRFKVFGKRAERSFTRTLDLDPGARVVRVRVQSPADKFDQTRVERFDLDSASVAALHVSADRSGLSLVAQRPVAPAQVSPAPTATAPAATPAAIVARADALAATAQTRQEASATGEVLQSLRSMLIAIAGFVASTATAFLIQEFLRSRRALIFADETQPRRGAPSV